jgi:hypothetical protein
MNAVCVNCGQCRLIAARGLCAPCWKNRGIRDRFALKCARSYPSQDFNGKTPLPATATMAMPGSKAKIAILRKRAQRRESLFHPNDAGDEIGLPLSLFKTKRRRGLVNVKRRGRLEVA